MGDFKCKLLLDKSEVRGEIYIMKNQATNKCYVGQTVTHRKNHTKYRPFGYIGRFKDHLSEARNLTKCHCRFLNNAIRKYGESAFTVELIETCAFDELDAREQHYIQTLGTLYPTGYNLTTGGRSTRFVRPGTDVDSPELSTPKKRGGCVSRSDETRAKMSERLKEIFAGTDVRVSISDRTTTQHARGKLARFKDVTVDLSKVEEYMIVRNSAKYGPYIFVRVDGKETQFVGRHSSFDELKERAIQFLQDLAAMPQNCSGTP